MRLKNKYIIAIIFVLAGCKANGIEVRPVQTEWQMDSEGVTKNYYHIGKRHLKESRIGHAIDAFRADIVKNGETVRSLNGLGIAYDLLGRFDLSQAYYERSLTIEADSATTLSNLAYSQYRQQEYEAAISLANMAKELLTQQDAKGEAKKSALENLQEAGEVKMKEESSEEVQPMPAMRVQRTGERVWEITKEWQRRVEKKPVDFKSNITIEQILERARQRKDNREKGVLQSEVLIYRIVNGTGRPRMAKRISHFLKDKGVENYRLANAFSYNHQKTEIRYPEGYSAIASRLAEVIPVPVTMVETNKLENVLEITLGADLISFDKSLLDKGGVL